MAYRACIVDDIFFCRWLELRSEEHTALLHEAERLAQATRSGRLSAMIVLLPHDLPMPDEKFRRAGIHSTRAVFDFVDQLIVVIEGRGVRNTVLRAAATAMANVAGVGSKAAIEDTLEAALTRVHHRLTMSLEAVLDRARLQGVAGVSR